MATAQGVIHAPIIKLIADELLSLVKNDASLRKLQGANAPQASYFDRAVALATLYTITQARSGNETFSSLVITFDASSGGGFYRIDSINAQAAPASVNAGVEIPAGGGILIIMGQDNITNFSMIAQTAATLTFARYLYK